MVWAGTIQAWLSNCRLSCQIIRIITDVGLMPEVKPEYIDSAAGYYLCLKNNKLQNFVIAKASPRLDDDFFFIWKSFFLLFITT